MRRTGARPLVIDASVAAKCVLMEAHSDIAQNLVRRMKLMAPDLLWAELGSVLWARHRRGHVAADEARLMLVELRALPITTYPSSPLLPAALDVAIALSHSLYDCLYLALAMAEDTAVVTADRRFHRAVSGSILAGWVVWIEDAP